MATTYDGSVRIDTRIDTKGFNAGMKQVRSAAISALNNILLTTLRIGTVIRAVVGGIALIGGALIGAAVAFLHFGRIMIQGMKQGIDETSSFYQLILQLETQFNRVKGAIYSLFATLLQAALPAIIQIVDWLVRMLDIINQVVAALLGQKTVMRVVASSTDAVAAHTDKAAKNTEKLKKAAQGALAAFDQIDVLTKPQTAETPSADTGTGGLQFEEAPVDQKWLVFAEQIKQAFLDAIERIRAAWAKFVEIWNAFWNSPFGQLVRALWENFLETWSRIFENTWQTLLKIKEGIERIFKGITQFITGILKGDWRLAWEGLKNIVGGVMDTIHAFVTGTFENILIFFDGWKNAIKIGLDFVQGIWRNVWTVIQAFSIGVIATIQNAWADFKPWFQRTVIDPLRNAFGSALDWIRDKFNNAFSGISNIARGAFNGLIDSLNGVLRRIAEAVNGMASMFNQFSWMFGISLPTVSAPQIPHLATGAVIPPNSEFLAVMGDQRSGRNIEAPEALLRQLVSEELTKAISNQTINVNFTGDLAALVRLMKPEIDKENSRVGQSLATTGSAK